MISVNKMNLLALYFSSLLMYLMTELCLIRCPVYARGLNDSSHMYVIVYVSLVYVSLVFVSLVYVSVSAIVFSMFMNCRLWIWDEEFTSLEQEGRFKVFNN